MNDTNQAFIIWWVFFYAKKIECDKCGIQRLFNQSWGLQNIDFVYGDLKVVDIVTYPEIEGEY